MTGHRLRNPMENIKQYEEEQKYESNTTTKQQRIEMQKEGEGRDYRGHTEEIIHRHPKRSSRI